MQVQHAKDPRSDFNQCIHYLLLPSPSFCSFSRDTSKSGLGGAGGICRQQIAVKYVFHTINIGSNLKCVMGGPFDVRGEGCG